MLHGGARLSSGGGHAVRRTASRDHRALHASGASGDSRGYEERSYEPGASANFVYPVFRASGGHVVGFDDLGEGDWACPSPASSRTQGFTKALQVSWCLWFLKGSALEGFVEGSTKVSPRFHQGFAKFAQVSRRLVFSVLGRQKVLWKLPPSLLETCLRVPQLFFAFSPTALGLGFFSHSEGLGAKWQVCLLGLFAANGFRLPKGSLECSPNGSVHWPQSLLRFLRQMAVASEKVLWRVPPTILYICLHVVVAS